MNVLFRTNMTGTVAAWFHLLNVVEAALEADEQLGREVRYDGELLAGIIAHDLAHAVELTPDATTLTFSIPTLCADIIRHNLEQGQARHPGHVLANAFVYN